MNRGSAERAVAESDLSMAEKLTMMMLLRRAHNDTLEVPDWFTPSMPQLAAEVTISVRWLQILLKHLELHGWVKVVAGTGRGHKSVYSLVPGADPGRCDCTKRRTQVHPLRREKGNRATPFTERKGELGHAERANSNGAKPQVSRGFAPRVTEGEGVSRETPACIGGCGKPARHGCATCWEHASLEAVR